MVRWSGGSIHYRLLFLLVPPSKHPGLVTDGGVRRGGGLGSLAVALEPLGRPLDPRVHVLGGVEVWVPEVIWIKYQDRMKFNTQLNLEKSNI